MRQVSKIILKKDNKILLQLRDNKPSIPYPAYWGLPGGLVEENEVPLQALKRELKEELNCEIKNIKLVGTIELKTNENKDTLTYYFKDKAGNIFSGEVKDLDKVFYKNQVLYLYKGDINKEAEDIDFTEGQKIQYFTLEELENLKTIPFTRDFIIKNKAYFFSNK